MKEDLIRYWTENSISCIKINRPEKANAYNQHMLEIVGELLKDIESDPKNRVIVITGAGDKAFCAGADLNEMKKKTYADALDLKSRQIFNQIDSSNKITIAAINGSAYGGGLELSLSCDLRICSSNARFAFPETRIGLIPAAGGTQRLAQIVGKGLAKEMILGNEIWNTKKAKRHGLVCRVAKEDKVFEEAIEWANKIALNDPLAQRLAKKSIDIGAKNTAGYYIEAISEALLYELKKG